MSSTTKLMTADELLKMPPDKNGYYNQRYELIKGELKKVPPTEELHGIYMAGIAIELANFVYPHLGTVSMGAGYLVECDPDTVMFPFAAFISNERLATVENFEKFYPFAPDIPIEVLNSGDTIDEIDEKIDLYFAAGARLVWLVNPKRHTVKVYSSPREARIYAEGETLDGSELLPGFQCDLAKVFAVSKC